MNHAMQAKEQTPEEAAKAEAIAAAKREKKEQEMIISGSVIASSEIRYTALLSASLEIV